MADFFKGLAGGFSTGLQFGSAMREREERERLREAMAISPQEMQQRQATPEEFGRAQAETQGLAAQDAAEFGLTPQQQTAYAPQMPAEGQRIGASQYGLGGQTFNRMPTQQEIESARYGAAANVIAERDPVAAMRMRQEQTRTAREEAEAPLRLKGLQQQTELGGVQLTEAQRKVKQSESNRTAETLLSELAAAGTPIDTATASRIANQTGADMKFVTESVLGQYNLNEKSANNLIQRQLTDFNKAAEGGIPTLNKYVADRLDPDKTDNVVPKVVQGADGKLRVMYGDKPLPGYQAYGSLDQLSAAFQGNIKRDPLGAAIQISTLETQAQAREASRAAVAKDRALAGLYAQGGTGKAGLKQKVADFKEVYGRDPNESEKGILAGLVNKPREFTTADVNARAKLLIDGGMMDPDDPTQTLSPQKALQIAQSELAGTPYVSAVDKLISDMADARKNAQKQTGIKPATPAGQELLDLYNVVTPPSQIPRSAPTTQQERLRAMTIPVRTGLQ